MWPWPKWKWHLSQFERSTHIFHLYSCHDPLAELVTFVLRVPVCLEKKFLENVQIILTDTNYRKKRFCVSHFWKHDQRPWICIGIQRGCLNNHRSIGQRVILPYQHVRNRLYLGQIWSWHLSHRCEKGSYIQSFFFKRDLLRKCGNVKVLYWKWFEQGKLFINILVPSSIWILYGYKFASPRKKVI